MSEYRLPVLTVGQRLERAKRRAKKIADELMSNSTGDKAARLQLRGPNEEDFGGYCRDKVIEILEEHLF